MSRSLIDLLHTAPLAGLSDSPFRLINRKFGVKYVYSEMVSVEGLWRKHRNTTNLLKILEGDSPLIVQLFGSKPDSFSKAVSMIEDIDYISEININSGCPVRKVIRSGSGSALMQNPGLMANIVAETRKATKKKVSVKLRSGKDTDCINLLECAKICQNEGADVVIVHPRTAVQMFSGLSDWSLIKEVKEALKIPVIGNGDVLNLDDAERMLKETGCDGVMIGRALVGNPWFFTKEGKKINQIFLDTVLKHIALSKQFYGSDKGYKMMKKHLIYYAKNMDLPGVNRKSYYEDICNTGSIENEIEVVKSFFSPLINL
ncbi:MAG: tRNA-dihydrouridine synthase family protein [bacterium]